MYHAGSLVRKLRILMTDVDILQFLTLDVQEQNNDPVSCKKCSLSFQNLMELQGNLIIASDDNLPIISCPGSSIPDLGH